MVRVFPEMAMWGASMGPFSFVISKDGDDPYMASVKIAGSRPFEGTRHDLGEFTTFDRARHACQKWYVGEIQ
jgi:hypothetical protein